MIAPLTLLAVALAGGVGASLRFVVDGLVKARVTVFPLATVIINVSGSFTLGVVTGLGARAGLSSFWVLVVGGGLVGGYTTFSTASVEAFRLLEQGRVLRAAVYGLGMLVVSVAAAALGLLLTGAL